MFGVDQCTHLFIRHVRFHAYDINRGVFKEEKTSLVRRKGQGKREGETLLSTPERSDTDAIEQEHQTDTDGSYESVNEHESEEMELETEEESEEHESEEIEERETK